MTLHGDGPWRERSTDMVKTVADQFAETLAVAGVKRIYGVVGDSLNGLTDSLRRQGKIEWIHVRHEEVAAFAAGAEADLTGELAVCAGSCGPGQFAPDQRSLRLPPLADARARHRCANSVGRDRRRLLSGNPPADAVPGMQPLLRTDLGRQSDAADTGGGDPRGRRQTRRVGGGDSQAMSPCRPRRTRRRRRCQASFRDLPS